MLATSTPRENTNLTSVFSSESLGWKKKKKNTHTKLIRLIIVLLYIANKYNLTYIHRK